MDWEIFMNEVFFFSNEMNLKGLRKDLIITLVEFIIFFEFYFAHKKTNTHHFYVIITHTDISLRKWRKRLILFNWWKIDYNFCIQFNHICNNKFCSPFHYNREILAFSLLPNRHFKYVSMNIPFERKFPTVRNKQTPLLILFFLYSKGKHLKQF